MKNSFQLTEKANEIILKILKTELLVSVVLLFVVILKQLSSEPFVFVITFGIICSVFLLTLKSHKVTGVIIFEKNAIMVTANGQNIRLPFPSVRKITLIFRGRKRSSYLPSALQPIGINRPDGTGNLIRIETEDNNYSYDIFLQNDYDSTALAFQIKRLADSGLKIEKRKLPAILGDSI